MGAAYRCCGADAIAVWAFGIGVVEVICCDGVALGLVVGLYCWLVLLVWGFDGWCWTIGIHKRVDREYVFWNDDDCAAAVASCSGC